MHGSATFKAREKAHETIILASLPAAKRLREILNDPDAPYNAVIAAARDLLDRADLAGKATVEVEIPAFERAMARAVKMRRPGSAPEPRVIEGEVVEDYRAREPGEEPAGVGYRPARQSGPTPAPPTRPEPAAPREPHVNSDDKPPSYIDAETGERRRPRVGPRSTTMRR